MPPPQPLCNLDNTWDDVLAEFKDTLKGAKAWSCFCLDGVDKEVILSAPETMDPKTDSGFGYKEINSLQFLLDSGSIPPASNLSGEKELVDVMDYIHAKELHYLRGYSLVQSYLGFPYFLRMDLLKQQNPTLYAYCRGVLRTLDCVLRAVFATTIRSDEEFMLVPPELDRQLDCSVEEILAELETAAASSSSPAVAARLRWRKHFLSSLNLFLEAKRRSDVEAACDISQDALTILESADFTRTTEPVVAPEFLREKEVPFWVSVITPTKPLDTPPFEESMGAYKTVLRQLVSLRSLLKMTSLTAITDYVEDFGAQQPLLPVRSIAVVVLFSNEPDDGFLFGLPLHQRLLEMVAKEFGAPLYLKVFEGDDASIEGVVKYRIHKTMDPLKITPEQVMYLRQQTIDAVRRWTSEACKNYLLHLETMLCNRGLAHRRLMNAMAGLSQFQEMSYSTDISVFLATSPGTAAETEAECIKCSTVLTLVANAFVLRAMELVVQFELELDLLSPGEVLPSLWYLNFTQRAQAENWAILCPQNTSFIPETRINRKTRVPLYNLALTTRSSGVLDAVRVSVLDAERMMSDAVFLSACLFESKGLIDLASPPKRTLISVEDVFNHRMLKCFGMIRSPPLTPYSRCMATKPNLAADPTKVPVYATKASEVATNAAEKVKTVLQSSTGMDDIRRASLRPSLEAMEKTARAVAASLASFAAVCDDSALLEQYSVTVDRPAAPSMLCFTLHKKQ